MLPLLLPYCCQAPTGTSGPFLWRISCSSLGIRRAEERTRTADLPSLRVMHKALLGGHLRLTCTRRLRRASPSKRARDSSESQSRRSKCPHSGHRRTHSPSSSTASRCWSSSPPQSQLSRAGVSSCSTGLAWTGCSTSPAVRSTDSKAERTRPARRGVSGSPVVRGRSLRRYRATSSCSEALQYQMSQ
jgi:hypothetical protein